MLSFDIFQGDRQVVETLRKEIDEQDWSLLILHFLGFDHIGHVEGSSSSKIASKLKEMDQVVKEIFHNKVCFKKDAKMDATCICIMLNWHYHSSSACFIE